MIQSVAGLGATNPGVIFRGEWRWVSLRSTYPHKVSSVEPFYCTGGKLSALSTSAVARLKS